MINAEVVDQTLALNETLVGIARQGELDPLYERLARAPNILDQIDEISFIHTPVHEAVVFGNTHLALEILRLKPSFGRKLNAKGQSPLHLALGDAELAKRLIEWDSELIRVKGKEGLTPLHHVAGTGETDLLAEFLCACPESIRELSIRGENALHIAAKEGQVDAFKVIFEWIWRSYNSELLSRKDEHGNTVLHIAVSNRRLEIVKLLVGRAPTIKDEINSEGLTALGIADEDLEMRKVLWRDIKRPPPDRKIEKLDACNLNFFLQSPEPILESVVRFFLYSRRDLNLDMRNLVLVVAVLIATATFDAPGKLGETEDKYVVQVLSFLNTGSFACSFAVMALVLSTRPYTSFLHLSLLFMVITYGYKMSYIAPWLMMPAIVSTLLVYAFKFYFDNLERRIFTEMPAIWISRWPPTLKAVPWTPVSIERLRMVYRLMSVRTRSEADLYRGRWGT